MLPSLPERASLQAFLPAVSSDDPMRTLKARAAVASTFAAGLELAKQNFLTMRQNGGFDRIEYATWSADHSSEWAQQTGIFSESAIRNSQFAEGNAVWCGN